MKQEEKSSSVCSTTAHFTHTICANKLRKFQEAYRVAGVQK
jgi:hypothetical protein